MVVNKMCPQTVTIKVRIGMGKGKILELSSFHRNFMCHSRFIGVVFKESGAPGVVSHAFNTSN